jgi:hypothetical protein
MRHARTCTHGGGDEVDGRAPAVLARLMKIDNDVLDGNSGAAPEKRRCAWALAMSWRVR